MYFCPESCSCGRGRGAPSSRRVRAEFAPSSRRRLYAPQGRALHTCAFAKTHLVAVKTRARGRAPRLRDVRLHCAHAPRLGRRRIAAACVDGELLGRFLQARGARSATVRSRDATAARVHLRAKRAAGAAIAWDRATSVAAELPPTDRASFAATRELQLFVEFRAIRTSCGCARRCGAWRKARRTSTRR